METIIEFVVEVLATQVLDLEVGQVVTAEAVSWLVVLVAVLISSQS